LHDGSSTPLGAHQGLSEKDMHADAFYGPSTTRYYEMVIPIGDFRGYVEQNGLTLETLRVRTIKRHWYDKTGTPLNVPEKSVPARVLLRTYKKADPKTGANFGQQGNLPATIANSAVAPRTAGM